MARDASMSGAPQGTPTLVMTTTSTEPRPMSASLGDQIAAAWMQGGTASTAAVVNGGSVMDSNPVTGWFPAVATRDGAIGVA